MPADPRLSLLIETDSDCLHALRMAEARLATARLLLGDSAAAFLASPSDAGTAERLRRDSAAERRRLAEWSAAYDAWEAAQMAYMGIGS